MTSKLQRTGRAAAVSGLLMLVGVEGEWVLDPQADDGTVTAPAGFALLVLVATAGFALLLVAVAGLRAATRHSRRARVGAALSVVGAGLLVAFGTSTLATFLATGQPWEPTFIAFLLGMLLLAVGPATWGSALLRGSPARGVGLVLVLAGLAALASLTLESDPWHDLAISGMFVSWSVVGLLLRRDRSGNLVVWSTNPLGTTEVPTRLSGRLP